MPPSGQVISVVPMCKAKGKSVVARHVPVSLNHIAGYNVVGQSATPIMRRRRRVNENAHVFGSVVVLAHIARKNLRAFTLSTVFN